MPTPTELAPDALQKTGLLQQAVDILNDQIGRLDLVQLRERVTVLEQQNAHLAKSAEEAEKLRLQLVVIEERVNELKKAKEESDRRQWQFVYIFAGAMASLLVTVVVQLVLGLVKKS